MVRQNTGRCGLPSSSHCSQHRPQSLPTRPCTTRCHSAFQLQRCTWAKVNPDAALLCCNGADTSLQCQYYLLHKQHHAPTAAYPLGSVLSWQCGCCSAAGPSTWADVGSPPGARWHCLTGLYCQTGPVGPRQGSHTGGEAQDAGGVHCLLCNWVELQKHIVVC